MRDQVMKALLKEGSLLSPFYSKRIRYNLENNDDCHFATTVLTAIATVLLAIIFATMKNDG